MNCFSENNADLLIGYFENTLSDADRQAVDAHAAHCTECAQLLELHTMLDDVLVPEVSPDFDARLYARIDEHENAQATRWSFLRWFQPSHWHLAHWKVVVPMTTVAAMLAVGAFVFRDRPAPVDNGQKMAVNQQQQVEIQQLEQALDDLELLMPAGPSGAI